MLYLAATVIEVAAMMKFMQHKRAKQSNPSHLPDTESDEIVVYQKNYKLEMNPTIRFNDVKSVRRQTPTAIVFTSKGPQQ